MSAPALYPLNDFALIATIKIANAVGVLEPLEAGVGTAFLATSHLPTATAADPSLVMTPTYTGAGGKWLVAFDASVLTPTLLASLFGSAQPHVIIQFPSSIRVAIPCTYQAAREIAL